MAGQGEGQGVTPPERPSSFFRDFFKAAALAAASKTAAAPLERVKLVLQTQGTNPVIARGQLARYTGMADCLTRLVKEQGVASLWRGNLVGVLRYFPAQAFNFAARDIIKSMFPRYNPQTEHGKFFLVQVASGGLAGALSMAVTYPLDYAQTRLATDLAGEFSGVCDCLWKSGLDCYSGYSVSIMGIFAYRALYFGLYDLTKSLLRPEGFLGRFLLANFVTALAGALSYPLDTIRRSLMLGTGRLAREGGGPSYTGTMDCASAIASREGVWGFFQGAVVNILRGYVAAAVLTCCS